MVDHVIDDYIWQEVDLGSKIVFVALSYRGTVIISDILPDVRGTCHVKELIPDRIHERVIVQ